jgi:hypothetical protein
VLESLLLFLIRHRGFTLAGAGLALVGLGLFWTRLTLNDSPERWMPASSAAAWRRFDEHFEAGDTIAIGLEFHRAVRDADLDHFRALRAELLKVPGVHRVYDASLIADQVEKVPLTHLLDPRSADRFGVYRGAIVDETGRNLVTFVELAIVPPTQLDALRRLAVGGVYRVIDLLRLPDVTYHTVGAVVIQYELERIARRLAVVFPPPSIVLGLLALGAVFRSPGALAIGVVGGVWSVVVLLGGISAAGCTLDVVTIAAPTLMAVIGIATTVHIAHHYAHTGPPQWRDYPHFVNAVAVPCLGAAVTTSVGFLMLGFNELGPVRELGFELSVGALLAFLGAFVAWLALHPFRSSEGRYLTPDLVRRFQRWVSRRPRTMIAAVLSFMAAMTAAGAWVRIDADPFAFFEADSAIGRALSHFEQSKFGLYNLEVVLVPRDRQLDPADRERARKFVETIQRRPEVRKVVSTVALDRSILSFDLADVRRAIVFRDTFTGWAVDKKGENALRITFMTHDLGSGFGDLVAAVRAALPEDRFECVYTGAAAQVVLLAEGLLGGIALGLGTALAVMAVVCSALFRSVRLAAIAFLPNAFPIVIVFGMMGLLGLPLNSGSAMVSTIALGVALNDTVHFILHYRRLRASGVACDAAMAETIGDAGRPILLTSVVNTAGFSIFLLSDFRPLFHFGLLSTVAMGSAVLGDLVLLPNLLKVFDRDRVLLPVPVPPMALVEKVTP